VAYGADGKSYYASEWRRGSINSGTQPVLEFDFDDSVLPRAAFPYVLDPTTYTADTMGGGIAGIATGYAAARVTANSATPGALTLQIGQNLSGSTHTVSRGFLSFDTSSIPADATIEDVRLEMHAVDASHATDFDIEVHQFAWAAPLDATTAIREANFDGCLAAPFDGVWSAASEIGTDPNEPYTVSEALDPTWIAKGGNEETRYCLLSSRDVAGQAPGGDEMVELAADDATTNHPRLVVTYTPAPHVAWFDGAEIGSAGTGIDLGLGECLPFEQTSCATGTTCRWSSAEKRSGDLGFEFDSGASGTQTPSLQTSVGTQGCGAASGDPCWMQACFLVPTTLTLPGGSAAPIVRYLSTTASDPEIGLREGAGNTVEVRGSWGATAFSASGLAKGEWHCAVVGFLHASAPGTSDGQFQLWVNREQIGASASVAGSFGSGSQVRFGILGALGAANGKLYLDDLVFVDAANGVSERPGDWRIEFGEAPTQDVGNGWTSFNANCSTFAGCTDERPLSDAGVSHAKSKPAGEWAAVHNPDYDFATLGEDETVVAVAAQACVSEQPTAQDPDYLLLLRADDGGSDSFCKGEVYVANHADYRLKTLVSTKAPTSNCNDALDATSTAATWVGIERGTESNSFARVSTLWMARMAQLADPTATPTPTPTPTITPTATATATPTPTSPPTPEEVDAGLDVATPPVAPSPSLIEPFRRAIIRGKVVDRSNSPLVGVSITIVGHLEFGSASTRTSGYFDIVVNGGDTLVVSYRKSGYLPVHRRVDVPWRDTGLAADVVMTESVGITDEIDLSETEDYQVYQGAVETDSDGSRRATILFPPGLGAQMETPTGTQTLTTMTVSAIEYTVGESGPEAMPADLPPSTAYTYAVELSVAEAVAAGADDVVFDQPVIYYVENFVGFPVGGVVPVGFYDRTCACWVAADNGQVVRILSIDGNGLAELDTDGDPGNDPDNGIDLGIPAAERERLAGLYDAGTELWRVALDHFSPWDLNWPQECANESECEPPTVTPTPTPTPTKPCEKEGSILCVQPQVLGERTPVVGTEFTLNYRSDRMFGRKANRTIDIPLSGSPLPFGLIGIELRVIVAGRSYRQSFAAVENLSTRFVWDGRDAYGERVYGARNAKVLVGYVYAFDYQQPEPVAQTFGLASGTGFPAPVPGRRQDMVVREYDVQLDGWDHGVLGLGGWSLDVHHVYDPASGKVRLGDGTTRGGGNWATWTIRTIGGDGEIGSAGDGGPALEASLDRARDVEVAADGSIFFVDADVRVRRIDADGIVTTVAGGGSFAPADGLDPTMVNLGVVSDIAVSAAGDLYMMTTSAAGLNVGGYVLRVDAAGEIRIVAGTGTYAIFDWCGWYEEVANCGDGGPAVEAQFFDPGAIALGPDRAVYVFDGVIRRIGPNGIIETFAGIPDLDFDAGLELVFGVPARESGFVWRGRTPMRFGPDGSLYTILGYAASWGSHVIVRITPSGILEKVAGNPDHGSSFVPAVDGTNVADHPAYYEDLYPAADGSIFVLQSDSYGYTSAVRRISAAGWIQTIAGDFRPADPWPFGPSGCTDPLNCPQFAGDTGPARNASLWYPNSLAVAPDGDVVVVDTGNSRIRRVEPVLPGFIEGDLLIPAEDGSEVYVFDASGRHLRTQNALTGAIVYTFGYDNDGLLETITDAFENETTIGRNGSGFATSIVAPGGQVTTLTPDPLTGDLLGIENPAGEEYTFGYGAGGLLVSMTDPRNKPWTYRYDADGYLESDEDPLEEEQTLSRTGTESGYEVVHTTAEGRQTTYALSEGADGVQSQVITGPNGLSVTSDVSPAGVTTTTFPNGIVVVRSAKPDPRFGMTAPLTDTVTSTPGGLVTETTSEHTVVHGPSGFLDVASLEDVTTVAGGLESRTYRTTWTASDPNDPNSLATLTRISPELREVVSHLDDDGRVARTQVAGLYPTRFEYDDEGRLEAIKHGPEDDPNDPNSLLRVTRFEYKTTLDDQNRLLDTISDAESRETSFDYDDAGRVTAHAMPDTGGMRTIGFAYDANGNMTSLTPPGRPAHGFTYTDVNREEDYAPPQPSPAIADPRTVSAYNGDRQLELVSRPDGQTVDPGYDVAGRLQTLTVQPSGETSVYAYDPNTGELESVTGPDADLSFTYDGDLLLTETWDWGGAVPATTVTRDYDDFLQVESLRVNARTPIGFAYDADGLLTGAGAMTVTRRADNGLIATSTLGVVTDTWTYSGFGELEHYTAAIAGTPIFDVGYERDKLGRITKKTETIEGVTTVYEYAYDPAGRLWKVWEDTVLVSTYEYDANGNRLKHITPAGETVGVYDDQDRLLSYGSTTYTYGANGELETATTGSDVTIYDYDSRGNLRSVTLPDSTLIEYLIDGRDRRVGRKVNGVVEKRWVYRDQLNPVAELDAAGNVVAEFVYGTKSNVPDYMIKNGTTHRIVSDHLGSVRLVIDESTGALVTRIDYGEFGVVALSSGTSQELPFAFAGGLPDPEVGLIRFGRRDYDPLTGTWTARDPIGLLREATNLYAYSLGDPINYRDSTGLTPYRVPAWVVQKLIDWVRKRFGKEVGRQMAGEFVEDCHGECDMDGDGLLDFQEDWDGDGILNWEDDSDGDGIKDFMDEDAIQEELDRPCQ
jgi:RHS repeat-associated protein